MYSTTGFEASNFVTSFNTSFNMILWVSIAFILFLTGLMVYFVFRYNRKKHKKAEQIEGNNALEITWTIIPIMLALVMFHFGWKGWTPMNKPPKDAINVTTMARMWSFTFLYENGKQSPDLVIPVSQAVNIKLVSLDVLHSLYIPEFRVKSDIVPGREKYMWFRSDREGEYDLYCAEYCGLRHSYMNATVRVLPREEFDKWYAETAVAVDSTAAGKPGSEGAELIKTNGCLACHSSDGSKIVGPTFLGLFGHEQSVLKDGQRISVTADEEYITRSIYEPNAEIVEGYQEGLMQPYKGVLNDEQVASIIEYLKTLNDK
ncbi:MAG TPA: cytochrome c oxidase subunit II [Bacteroidales bacterium]|nr:cytochrome c oxidase subunit II [Bacteroidales bacterium]